MSFADAEERLFGFEAGDWFERVRAAESGAKLGTLGSYRLIDEVGRGGQGVVFRAIQPGTGRTIAIKRLLAGSFASPPALRRFQREAEAAASLVHPGIVAVHGVEIVDGAPLLTMEWVDGSRITEWAKGRAREEILRAFLQVCDAVQHAHRNGVLHRDLKPANVLVDSSDRPRLLDFGLARFADVDASSLTESGLFLGTPAYAAPEQFRGESLDARADVFALGSILYELLTGRRAIEGEGIEAFARAAQGGPPRPSATTRRIPRDLDAIVAQAMASEPSRRYPSVEALAADMRRFLEGRPVLAHGPGALYLLRKFAARNPLATAAVLVLIGTTIAYAVSSVRHARTLGLERDKAVAASVREKAAHDQAVEEKARAEERQHEAEQARESALEAKQTDEEILSFLVVDVLAKANPETFGRMPTMLEILSAASQRVPERFGAKPAVEMHVRYNLGLSFKGLGAYAEAERELRRCLELRQGAGAASQVDVARCQSLLGGTLILTGKFEEARSLLRASLAWLESADPSDAQVPTALHEALANSLLLAMKTNRLQEALELNDRLIPLATDATERILDRACRASVLSSMERNREALDEYEALLPEYRALLGENSINMGILLQSMSGTYRRAGDLDSAIATGRQALEVLEAAYGPEHFQVATTLARLAEALYEAGKLEEARATAERGIASLGNSGSRGLVLPDLHVVVGSACLRQALSTGAIERYEKAAEAFKTALALYDGTYGRSIGKWVSCARNLHWSLVGAGRFEEADALLLDVAPDLETRCNGWVLGRQAMSRERRGEEDEAYGLYEQAIAALENAPTERTTLVETLKSFAAMLKRLGDPEGAAPLESRAAELARKP